MLENITKSILLMIVALSIISCKNERIEIKGYKDNKQYDDSLENCFYINSEENIKEQVIFFNGFDAYALLTINGKKIVFSPTYEQVPVDSTYYLVDCYAENYTNKGYKLILKLNKTNKTTRQYWKGVMIVKNNKGDSVVKMIAGSFH